ncbi:MAG: hypothetical protein ACRDTE_33655 [Pseudonocardiaceae bacterium]
MNQGRLSDGIDLGRAARDAIELANAAHEVAKSTPALSTWFGPAALESQLAQSALTLSEVPSLDCRALLNDADQVLSRTATDPTNTARHAVIHVTWLARAHVAADDLDRAVPAAHAVLNRLSTVRSRRCELVLRRLEDDLAALPPARRPAAVRSLHDQLRATHTA